MDACLDEVAYSFDVLKADGVTLLISYNGQYLGHPAFRPLWDELDRRAAVDFIHPSSDIHAGVLKEPWLPPPMIDFPHETTRTAVHLIIADTVRDHPNCKIILSHGGGTLPYMATRIAYQLEEAGFMQKSAAEFMEEARGFYFDLALTGYSYPLDVLQKFAEKDHILYGSDFPFARKKTVERQRVFLDEISQMGEVNYLSVKRGAAQKLFPAIDSTKRTVALYKDIVLFYWSMDL